MVENVIIWNKYLKYVCAPKKNDILINSHYIFQIIFLRNIFVINIVATNNLS